MCSSSPARRRVLVAACLVTTLAACGSSERLAPSSPEPSNVEGSGSPAAAAVPTESVAPAATASGAQPTVGASSTPKGEPAPAAAPAPSPLTFKKALDGNVTSIALGERGRVAVLAPDPRLFDGKRWTRLKLPAGDELSADDGVWIFFGRDHQPRLMGRKPGWDGDQAVYLRWRQGRWKRERGEIGRLSGNPPGPLYGWLGYEDPEVVCKRGDVCIVKSRKGWNTVPPVPSTALPHVTRTGNEVWAYGQGIWRVSDKGWVPVEPPLNHLGVVSGLWAEGPKRLWAVSPAEGMLHRLDGGKWTPVDTPVRQPRALWGAAPDDLWLVGAGGLGHYDGSRWRAVAGPPGPLGVVVGRSAGDVWIGGATGLWHGTK